MARLVQNLKLWLSLVLVGGFGAAFLMVFLGFPTSSVAMSQLTLALVIGAVALRMVNDNRQLRRQVERLERNQSKETARKSAGNEDEREASLRGQGADRPNMDAVLERLERSVAAQDLEIQRLSSQLSQTAAMLEADTARPVRTQSDCDDLASRLDTINRRTDLIHGLVGDVRGYKGKDVLSRVVQQLEATIGIYALLDPRLVLPSSRGWAASPDFLAIILNAILSRESAPNVVEFGSGLSTLVSAYALERRGDRGWLMSVEHDAEHAERVGRDLRLHGFSQVELVTAPLSWVDLPPSVHPGGERHQSWWYDTSVFTPPTGIDVLVVDGPPGRSSADARYPAVPMLAQCLARDAVILLDDADREAEQRIARWWADELHPCTLELLKTEKGAAVLQRRDEAQRQHRQPEPPH